ncbi:MAG: substrate-binding domain-containing protein [Planctomycetota bacterium]|nr:MAG: substrate-binding domain-containing protein [Planctomycetota bacterium]
MFHRVRLAGLLLMIGILTPTGGCEEGPVTQDTTTKNNQRGSDKGFIAFVGAGEKNPLWPILKTGSRRYTRYMGDIEFRYFSPKGHSPKDQIELLKTLEDPKMRGLCIQIIDPDAIRFILEKMFTRGITIVSMINPAPERIRVGHVGFNDENIGEAIAKATIEVLGGTGSIMVLHADTDHPTYGPRLTAFEKKLASHREIDIYAKINCHANPLEARDEIRRRSARYPRLSAWVALDDWPIREIQEVKTLFAPGCKFVTFGGLPSHWPLIRSGTSPVMVAAHYRNLGYEASRFCEMEIRHESHFKHIDHAQIRFIRPTNLNEYIDNWSYWSTGLYTKKEIGPG